MGTFFAFPISSQVLVFFTEEFFISRIYHSLLAKPYSCVFQCFEITIKSVMNIIAACVCTPMKMNRWWTVVYTAHSHKASKVTRLLWVFSTSASSGSE